MRGKQMLFFSARMQLQIRDCSSWRKHLYAAIKKLDRRLIWGMYSYDQLENGFQSEVFMPMKSPCEEIVWDVLPSIRAATAEELIKRGISQKEVSRMLGITPPAVSQYLSKKRGYNIEFREDIRQAIGILADDLISGQVKGEDLVKRICAICRMLQDDSNACISTKCKGLSG